MLHAVIDGWGESAKREVRDTAKSCSALTIELIKCARAVRVFLCKSAVSGARKLESFVRVWKPFVCFFLFLFFGISLRPSFTRKWHWHSILESQSNLSLSLFSGHSITSFMIFRLLWFFNVQIENHSHLQAIHRVAVCHALTWGCL